MFGKSIELFRVFGFPIRIDWSWMIIVVLITWSLATGLFPVMYEGLSPQAYWLMGAVGALGLFVSIVVHELSHAMIARRHDLAMRGITLFIFGGVAEMQDEPRSPGVEFYVAIAGPIASIAIALLFFALHELGRAVSWPMAAMGVLGYLATINLILVAFNLLPAFPLDGGRVLRSALWKWKGSLFWATSVTSQIGSAFGIVLIILGVATILGGGFIGGMWWVLIGMFLRSAAQMSRQQLLMRRALGGEPVNQFMQTPITTVPPETTVRSLVEDYVYRHHYKLYPVTREGVLLGCVSLKDIKEIPKDQWDQIRVEDIARPCDEGNTVRASDDAAAALGKMSRDGCSRLMVVDNGDLVGVLTLKDLLKFISVRMELEGNGRVPKLMQQAAATTAWESR